MTAPTTADRFRWIHLFRRNGMPNQILRVLEDSDGWVYVLKLAGTMDFGPYMKDELVMAFDLESEPCGSREFKAQVADDGATQTEGTDS